MNYSGNMHKLLSMTNAVQLLGDDLYTISADKVKMEATKLTE